MSEILEFPKHKRLTADGRFLLASEQQKEQEAEAAQTRQLNARTKPTAAQSNAARTELNHLFSGDNLSLSEELYQQGLSDVVNRRTNSLNVEERFRRLEQYSGQVGLRIFGFAQPLAEETYTDAALFYIYVQRLTETANHAHDAVCPSDQDYSVPDTI